MGEEVKKALIAFTSSSIAIGLTYPIETIYRQTHVTTNATNVRFLISQMVKNPYTAYSGVKSALITQPLYWAIYMPLYPRLKELFAWNPSTSFESSMAAGWLAGAIGTVATNPLWVIRQRLQTNIIYKDTHTRSYKDIIGSLYKEGRIGIFFRGTQLTLIKNIQMAFLIPLFEYFRSDNFIINVPVSVAAGASKIISSSGVYPLDVIRTNMRCQRSDVTPKMWQTTQELKSRPGGTLNFFRGIPLYWLNSASMFAVMMTLQDRLNSHFLE